MRNRLRLALPALLLTGACGDGSRDGLRIMVPNTPGGGYDTTARVMARVMDKAGIASDVQVFNLPGAGGTVGLRRTVNERGNGRLALQMGLGVVGASHLARPEATVADTTPLARLIEEASAVVVPKNSPYRTVGELVDAWRADPARVTVGGGSSPGGPDHLAPMLMARAAGITPKDVNYIPFDGGGELLASILGSKVAFGVSGVGEYLDQIKSGELRLLAVTGTKRVAGLDAPTLQEAGYDVEFTNWRGVVAPPGISDAQRDKLVTFFEELHASGEWQESLKRNGWDDAFLTGDAFGTFLDEQDARVVSVLKELGL